MVGEACAHVQGESLKAYAALLTEASQLPDHQGGEQDVNCKIRFLVAVVVIAAASANIHASFSQQPHFIISVGGGLLPIIMGTTDLPDGTEIFVNVKKPWLFDGAQRVARGLSACGEDCISAEVGAEHLIGITVTIRNRGFTVGPFSFKGEPFKPGTYPIEISASADPKTATPEQIRAIGKILYASTIRVIPAGNSYHATPQDAPSRDPTVINRESEEAFYHSRYMLAGFLLRAGAVCSGDWKRTIAAGFGLLSSEEFKTMSKAYPDTSHQWMDEGATNFNTGTMTDGVGAACAYAMKVRSQAEEIAQTDR
jgi:hypothetical protein